MSLAARVHRDVRAVPWRKGPDGRLRGGLFDPGGFVEGSRVERLGRSARYLPADHPGDDLPPLPVPRALYAGHWTPSFGHFLLEGLARLWAAPAEPDLPLLWLGGRGYAPWQAEALRLLGVRNPAHFLAAPARVAEVAVPEAGYVIPDRFAPEHARFLACVPAGAPVPGRWGWLSRSGLAEDAGRVEGEAELEGWLAGRGWTIFHPEAHTLAEQLAFLGSCERLAGWEGSAFHALILLEEPRARVTILARGERVNGNYLAIARAKGLDQEVAHLALDHLGGGGKRKRWRLTGGLDAAKARLA